MTNENLDGLQQPSDDAHIRELLESTDRMLEMTKQGQQKSDSEKLVKPAPVFEVPPTAAAELAAKEQERSGAFDRLDDQGIFSNPVIERELAKQGLEAPPSAEEIEAKEVAEITAHASDLHKPRQKSSRTLWRPKTSIQRDMADNDPVVRETYREQDELRDRI